MRCFVQKWIYFKAISKGKICQKTAIKDILVWQKRPFHNLTKYTSCKKTKQKKHLEKMIFLHLNVECYPITFILEYRLDYYITIKTNIYILYFIKYSTL